MDRETFFARATELIPGTSLGPHDPLAGLRPFQRLALTRWIADLFVHPVDLGVVRRFVTLDEVWVWLSAAIDRGEQLRPVTARSVPGATTRVRLRPLVDDDVAAIYLASLDPAASNRWRYRGRTVPIEELVATLHDGVRAQYVVEMLDDGRAVGIVVAYEHHDAGRHAKVGVLRFADHEPGDDGAVMEGLVLLVGHLFRSYPYRKLYIELPAYNAALLEPGIFEVEGILREHLFHEGEPTDLYVAALWRDRWAELSAPVGW
jgi:RimJ/RimL family protein N-acetyltransferase